MTTDNDLILKKLILYWGCGIFGTGGITKINWVEGPQGDATYQRPCGFRQEDFFLCIPIWPM